ncbi:MAG: hypothetical protein ABI183_20025 [Polyangiaceae bacterium]
MERIAQIGALLFALLFLAFSIRLRMRGRGRIGAVFVTMGALFVGVISLFLALGFRGSPLLAAPGHGFLYSAGRHVFHEDVPGIFGAQSYALDLYGTSNSAATVAADLQAKLAPLGYVQTAPTPGPVLRDRGAAHVAQFKSAHWQWRVYELALPTRFAGASYGKDSFPHLVAIMLCDDG